MDNQEIWIEGSTLFYKDIGGIEKANLNTLKYAYIQVLGGIPYLFAFADHQHYISTQLQGFEEIYNELSNRFHFDNNAFSAAYKAKKENEKVKIWTKKMPRNYQILDEYVHDVYFGYEVYAEPKQILSWDTTCEELEATGLIEDYLSDFGARYFRFKYPVRIGRILIHQLELYVENILPDRPIQEYYVDLYDETNTDQSYRELRKLWIDDNADIDQYGYERNDQCYLRFTFIPGIDTSICYTYDDDSGYDDGSTSLHIYNEREYTYFLDNKAYEDVMEISAVLSLHKKMDISISHMDNSGIKYIPLKVQELLQEKSGIWVDHLHHKIGLAGTNTALILDLEQIDHFEIQNVLPAKGPGYADFLVHLKTGNYLYIFTADTYYFDQFTKQLHQLTKKSVKIPEAYYNC